MNVYQDGQKLGRANRPGTAPRGVDPGSPLEFNDSVAEFFLLGIHFGVELPGPMIIVAMALISLSSPSKRNSSLDHAVGCDIVCQRWWPNNLSERVRW